MTRSRTRMLAVAAALTMAMTGAVAGSATTHGASAKKSASLGHELCAKSTPFIYMIFANIGGGGQKAWCYDGTMKHVPVPAVFKDHGVVAALDNQSGHRIILSGTDANGGDSFRYCYDAGYDWALGPPADGGDMEQDLLLHAVKRASRGNCPVWTAGAGTNDPGAHPAASPGCQVSGHLPDRGGHVFVVTGFDIATDGGVDHQTHYYCLTRKPHTTSESALVGSLVAVVNGSPHRVIVKGSNYSACVAVNHAISPVKSADQNNASSIKVSASKAKHCPH